MSDIADLSVHSHVPSPLHSSTLNSKNGDVTYNHDTMKTSNQSPIMNNMKTNTENDFIKTNNNHNLRTNNNDYTEKSEYKDRPLKLKVVITSGDQNGRVMNVVNDLSKMQSPMVEKNTVTTDQALGTDKQSRKSMPIMGRHALLKKANIEQDDSLIIYDLITEKYNAAISHYLDRSSQRRRLRADFSDNNSDTSYSSPPLSVSSISTPGSMGPDDRLGFRFPVSGFKADAVLDEGQEVGVSNEELNDFRFIVSTDEANAETTVEERDSLTNTTCATEKSGNSVSDYDPKKFLDDALGEITNLSIAYGVSNETVDNKKDTVAEEREDRSIGTSNLSTLLSRASSLYISATSKRKIKRSYSVPSTPQLAEISENRLSYNAENSYLEHLMKELSLQNEIMFQVSKALNYCKATKKFESSIELLEAEKILLVAYCTKEALTKEIQNAEDDMYEKRESQCCGEVTLSDLTFHLKDGNKTDAHRDFTEYFLAILTCGSIVLASEIITADKTGEVHVKRKFSFYDLAADFEISVCIYAMRVGNKSHASQDQKINCPSPKKIFCHLKKGSKKYKVLSDVVYIKPSSFTLWGKCQIRTHDLSKAKNNIITLKMLNTPLSASLSGTFSVKINTDVKLTNKISGFLTIGTENEHGCTMWNRRWCVLEGSSLMYWNYPSEEESSPLGCINLNNCLEQYVHVADRSICARPRTLMLPIKRNETEKKYLLSADNSSSMEEWEKEINDVVCTLRVWNRIDV